MEEPAGNKMHGDPLESNCPRILAASTRVLGSPLNDCNTTHMATKSTSRASRKRMVRKTNDIPMVDGRPTDIVILCDYIQLFIVSFKILFFHYHYLVLWAQPELEKAPYAPCDIESLFSLTNNTIHSSSTSSSGKIMMSCTSAMIFRLALPDYNTQLSTTPLRL